VWGLVVDDSDMYQEGSSHLGASPAAYGDFGDGEGLLGVAASDVA
jgi:hypothetical protein